MDLQIPSPLQSVELPVFKDNDVSVFIKRDDLIHHDISGNKWRKLKFNIEKYRQGGYEAILTFGGAYSNHIAATAYLGHELNIPTIGIIRGKELDSNSNTTLKRAAEHGMQLEFVSRDQYKERYEKLYWERLRVKYGHVLIIEEGGANFHGLIGCSEMFSELPFSPEYLMTASGTGTTAAGLLMASEQTNIISVPVFKSGGFIQDDIKDLLTYAGLGDDDLNEKMSLLDLELRFHFGGYGKHTQELIDFMNDLYRQTQIPLDKIYTAKMVYAFMKRLKEGAFKRGSRVVLLHTGGLQGNASIASQLDY